ncbi:hypothetical protein Adt_03612 [Abeliophyllum distichum]|uniref:Uncharacterized protein n=1 Tax=Abeliophyllum distichum TaxID=126358 RepID=A0ABD1VZ06_9LAMI
MPPCYPSWTEVPEEQRAKLCSIIESYFDLQGDRLPDEYRAVCAAVNHLAADRYQDYKRKDKLVEVRKTQQTKVTSSGTSVDERAIAKGGSRRRASVDECPKEHPISSMERSIMTILGLLCMRLCCTE